MNKPAAGASSEAVDKREAHKKAVAAIRDEPLHVRVPADSIVSNAVSEPSELERAADLVDAFATAPNKGAMLMLVFKYRAAVLAATPTDSIGNDTTLKASALDKDNT